MPPSSTPLCSVQAKLAANLNRSDLRKGRTGALLMGRVQDDRGNPMSPSHTLKKGVRYRYYVSSALVQGRSADAGAIKRLPAHEVETIVMAGLRSKLKADPSLEIATDADLVKQVDLRVALHVGQMELTWRPRHPQQDRCDKDDVDRTLLALDAGRDQDADPDHANLDRQQLLIPYVSQPHKRRREIILPDDASEPVKGLRPEEQHNLLHALAKGRALLKEIAAAEHVDLAAIAKREKKSERSVRATLSLAFLDPKLVRASINGTLPRGFGAKRLIDLPPTWPDQWRALGLPQPG